MTKEIILKNVLVLGLDRIFITEKIEYYTVWNNKQKVRSTLFGKFWSVSVELFVEHKPWNCEESKYYLNSMIYD